VSCICGTRVDVEAFGAVVLTGAFGATVDATV